MFNAKKLTVVRKGQYPTFRQTGSYYLGLPFVISRGFLFSSFVPNLGLPLLFWKKETDLKNGYSLWVPRSNNKSIDELRLRITEGIGRIVVDSFDEMDRLDTSNSAKTHI